MDVYYGKVGIWPFGSDLRMIRHDLGRATMNSESRAYTCRLV